MLDTLLIAVVDDVADPRKRIFWAYLLSAAVIAITWMTWRRGYRPGSAFRALFSRETWLGRSARADYKILFLNNAIMRLVSPALLTQLAFASICLAWLQNTFNDTAILAGKLSDTAVAIIFTLTLFVVDDFARYWVHRIMHRVPFLWAFHQVHHSATSLTPITVFRTHPVESLIFSIRSTLIQGSCVAVFFFLFGQQVHLATVLGAGIFTFIFNALGSNLRHSHVPIGFWQPLENIFMSPAQHQVHHSIARAHHDKNFGVALSLWDWLFGTLFYSRNADHLEFGLKGCDLSAHSLKSLYLTPFLQSAKAIRSMRPGMWPGTRPEKTPVANASFHPEES